MIGAGLVRSGPVWSGLAEINVHREPRLGAAHRALAVRAHDYTRTLLAATHMAARAENYPLRAF